MRGRLSIALLAPFALAVVAAAATAGPPPRDEPATIQAAAGERSYEAGRRVTLVVATQAGRLSVQLFRAGAELRRSRRDDVMSGAPVSKPVRFRAESEARTLRLGTGATWPSGLYFARLTGSHGRLGFAPFVLRAPDLGRPRVAVVLPTNTWEAYNFRDVDGDGVGDTWYADPRIPSVDLSRPYLNRGVPPHFRGYDAGFLRWMSRHGKRADFLSDDDLERIPDGRSLARLYDLVIFSGHEEYATPHAYRVVEGYRDLGGNLAFLSANNFFYRVERRGDRIFRLGKWRDVGRPEGRLTGADYVGWFRNVYRSAPYVVAGARSTRWLFAGTGLRNGDRFGSYGIEIDDKGPSSPRGTRVLARIPNVFGAGRSAEMTYYTTRAGAKVFSAGSLNFGGSVQWPLQARLMENLWRNLARP